MSKPIKYVATIEKETGRILNVLFPNQSMPEEGVDADGNTILYINEDNMPTGFMLPQFRMMEWVCLEGEFINVGSAPNRHAIYNGSEWTWDAEAVMADIKGMRNFKIAATDWTQTPDAPLSDEKVSEYRLYRQALRDFPSTLDNPSSLEDLDWPTAP